MEVPEDTPPTFEMEVVEDAPSSVTPWEDHLGSMVAPPSSLVASFDWNRFAGFRLPSYVPFEITVQALGLVVPSTIIDEGASVSILSSTTWQAFGSPPLAPVTQNLLTFNRRTSQPLGILPRLPVTLGGKTVHMDVMVVPGPLDFNLPLGQDYTYAMGALVSSLFRVACFPHEGRIVTIDQLSFFGPNVATGPPSPPPGFYPPIVSSPPQVNYVATCPVPIPSDSAIVH